MTDIFPDLELPVPGSDVSVRWFNAVADIVNGKRDLAESLVGPVGPTFNSGWSNYSSGYYEAQFWKFGPMVIFNGLVRYDGAAVAVSTLPEVCTVPPGFLPHASGTSPIGGVILTEQLFSGIANAKARVDILTNGVVRISNVNQVTSGNINPGTWLTLNGHYLAELV